MWWLEYKLLEGQPQQVNRNPENWVRSKQNIVLHETAQEWRHSEPISDLFFSFTQIIHTGSILWRFQETLLLCQCLLMAGDINKCIKSLNCYERTYVIITDIHKNQILPFLPLGVIKSQEKISHLNKIGIANNEDGCEKRGLRI